MVAAAGADELEQVGVAAFEAAVRDAGRLAPQERRPAVAGLAGRRECHGVGPRRSHGSRRSPRCGAGMAAGRRAGLVEVRMSGAPGLPIQLTARR
jgi:hypothetical protein